MTKANWLCGSGFQPHFLVKWCHCACASCDKRNYFLLELFGLVIGESPACLASSRLVTKFWLIKRWSFSNLSDDRNSCLLLCSFLSSCLCLQEVPQHFSILFSLLMIRGMHTECLKKQKVSFEGSHLYILDCCRSLKSMYFLISFKLSCEQLSRDEFSK